MPEKPVYYFARFVPGYRVPILEQLNERLDGRLIVCSGQPPGAASIRYLISDQARAYREVRLRNFWLRGDKIHAQPFRRAFEQYGDPAVVLAEESPRSLTLPLLLSRAGKKGAGRVLWGHFSSLRRSFDPERHLFDRYRLRLARSVEACACYTPGVADLLRPFVREENLFVARNTINLSPLLAERDALAMEGKVAIRERLSVSEDAAVLVYLGRLIPQKGTEMLLEAYRILSEQREATLFVIGDGPDRERMEVYAAANVLKDVRFLGPLSDDDAAPYLFASDAMVMPGYLGLVINHAFAFGLPVISMRRPAGIAAHSPEVEYVESGETGMLCDGETADDLVAGINAVISDLPRFSRNALSYARTHLTVDRMVDGLYDAIQHARQN